MFFLLCISSCLSKLPNVVVGVPYGSGLGQLLLLLYTLEHFSTLKNKLTPVMQMTPLWWLLYYPQALELQHRVVITVAESLTLELGMVSEWCDLRGPGMARSHTMHPQSPPLTVGGSVLKEPEDHDILGVTFDSKMKFWKHLHAVSRAASERLNILRKSWRVFHDRSLLGRCFRGFVLPVLEYCYAVWCSLLINTLNDWAV